MIHTPKIPTEVKTMEKEVIHQRNTMNQSQKKIKSANWVGNDTFEKSSP